jgi:hypothetical protein
MEPAAPAPQPARPWRKRGGLYIIAIYAMICGAIFLLQLFPVTGIFLMFMMAIAWIGVVINIGMVHLAIASLVRSIALPWILLPIGFYVGGLAAHYRAVASVATQTDAIERANAAATVAATAPLSFFVKGLSIDLLELYRIDRMVSANGSNRPATIYYYARGEECASASRAYNYQKRDEPFQLRPDLFPVYKGNDKTRQCILQKDGPPGEVHYRIETASVSSETFLRKQSSTKWTVYDVQTGAPLTSAQSAEFSVIEPIPMLLAGCGLVDNPSSWRCDAQMMKESIYTDAGPRPDRDGDMFRTSDPQTWEVGPLGRALSLKPRQPTD